MNNKKVVQTNTKVKDTWENKGFSCPLHAAGYHYFNRQDDDNDRLEILEYCGEN